MPDITLAFSGQLGRTGGPTQKLVKSLFDAPNLKPCVRLNVYGRLG